jgi:hypothetical protein
LFDFIDAVLAKTAPPFGKPFAATRLHSLLVQGGDQLGARLAIARGWDLVAPLPFGPDLNRAIHALPGNPSDARALLAGTPPSDKACVERAEAIKNFEDKAVVFALADDDAQIEARWLAALEAPQDARLGDAYRADVSERAALAGRVMIEQSDFIIAIWDGARTTMIGGTGHTVAAALAMGAGVVWIDVAEPEAWRILSAPEALRTLQRPRPADEDREAQLAALVENAVRPFEGTGAGAVPNSSFSGFSALDPSHWRGASNPLWHAYRRVEAIFSGDVGSNPMRNLRQTYETPDQIGTGSGAAVREATEALPGGQPGYAARIVKQVMERFAWADGISSQLSDAYRGGMVISFVLSACAIVGGLLYLPLLSAEWKWLFAIFELCLLFAIVMITYIGQKRRWHSRWFETRRAAEYLRHAPMLLPLGVARAPGRWPVGAMTSWPEHYARHAMRDVGLPSVRVSPDYLRHALWELLDKHISAQREYHLSKARKLATVHHKLDKLSETLFKIAVFSVACYLLFAGAEAMHLISHKALEKISKVFTFLGVALPTFAGAIAGIRFFGDFERFAAISLVTAEKLGAVEERARLLMEARDGDMDYGPVADIARAADDIVVSEIESWQAVFAGKHITVPV